MIVSSLSFHIQGIVFKSFEALARLDRELAGGLIVTARQSVEENETSRGCGEDKRLRLV